MNLKIGQWYRTQEKHTGCFEGVSRVLELNGQEVLCESATGTRMVTRLDQWDFTEIDAAEKAICDIGLDGIATTMDKMIVIKMIAAGYSK